MRVAHGHAVTRLVLEATLKRTTRDKKGVRYTFAADEALVILQTTLQRVARAGAKPNALSALSETLEALSELEASARERKLLELVTTRLRAAGPRHRSGRLHGRAQRPGVRAIDRFVQRQRRVRR